MQLDRESGTTDSLPMALWQDYYGIYASKATCVSAFRETEVLVGGALYDQVQGVTVPAII